MSFTMVVMLSSLVAQAPERSEAVRAFDEGKAAMKANDLGRACPLLEKSFTLEPALGTLLNLATCFEQQGKMASAWVRFNEATSWAQRTREAKREAFATERATALKARVSWLSLSSSSAAQVKVDAVKLAVSPGVPVALPVDVGVHVVTREQAGFAAWTTQVQIEREGATTTVTVPELLPLELPGPPPLVALTPEPEPEPVKPAEVVVAPKPVEVKTVVAEPSRAPGWVLVATGVTVAVAGGVGLGWSFATYDQLQSQRRSTFSPVIRVTQRDFDMLQWVYPASWAAAGVGLATAISGAIVLFTTRSAVIVPVVGPQGAGAAVSLSF